MDVGELSGLEADRRTPLPTEGPAIGKRRRRGATRDAPTRVRFEVRRLDPGRLQCERPLALGELDRMAQRHPAAAPLHLGKPAARGGEVVGHRHRFAVTDGDQGPGGCGVTREPAAAEDHRGSRGLERRSLHLGPPTGQQRVTVRCASPVIPANRAECVQCRVDDALPTGATAQMGQQRRPDGALVGLVRPSRQRGQPHEDPGGAEPALAGPGLDERIRPAIAQRRIEALNGGHLPPGDPSRRGDTGHPGGAVDPDRAAPALSLGTAAVLHRPAREAVSQHVEQ